MRKFTHWTKWLVVATIILMAGNLLAAIPALERTALIAFYNSTDGDNWRDNSDWKDGDLDTDGFAMPGTEGDWVGVTVAEVYGADHVTRIVFLNNNLVGPIAAELGNLSKLEHLYLYSNSFSGSIPATLGNLSNLYSLYLHNNTLSGSIPTELTNLTNLYEFNIGYNALYTDDATLRAFLNTNDSDWDDTQTVVPTDITTTMTGADEITLSWTPIPFTDYTGGYSVYYSETSGGPYNYEGVTSDKSTASLTVSGLTPGFPYYFVVQTTTNAHENNTNTVLSDSSAEVSATINKERAALIELYNRTNGDNWTNNSGWKTEPLAGDGFAMPGTEGDWYGVTVAEVDGSDHVTGIDLHSNNLTGLIPTELGNLSNLTGLWLDSNSLSGSIPMELGDLSNLTDLLLSDNSLSGSIPAELGNLSNLTNLWLDSNSLSGSIPTELGDLSNLTDLVLSSNSLSGSIPTELGDLSQLMGLYLSYNSLSGSIPAELGKLSNLNRLSFYGNSLSGSIPTELGDLSQLMGLYLSENSLSGSIPAELGKLSNLNSLSLYENSLSGSIPVELGNLSQLMRLALNGNRLSGSIPTELATLEDLATINIGYNALYTDDATLKAFLNTKDPDWAATQTVFPADITATMSGPDEITLNWTPIAFTDYDGAYMVFFSETSGGPYIMYTFVSPKSVNSAKVSGLTPGLPYYFALQTATDWHENNSNEVYSETSPQVQGIITLDETKMMATPLAGYPGTTVQFSNACGGKVNRFLWDFGDGTVEGYRHATKPGDKVHPSHTYGDTGDFTVSMTAFGWESAPPDTLIMPNLVCISEDYAPLAVMEGAETHSGYGWAKTIDQDVFNISGKMTADLPDVECVYSFTDSTLRNVNRVRLFIDDIYKKNYPGHLTGKFEVWVSVDNVSWTQALATSIPWEYRGTFADFTFAPVLGRYVKLKLTEPHNPNAEIIQLTEFQVFGAKSEDTTLEKGLVADNALITEYKLAQNYPNPFNPTTTISFALPEAAHVSLQVYSVTGRMVAELVNGHQDAGRHQVVFDAASLSSGVYFCVMRAANMEQVNRMILMK